MWSMLAAKGKMRVAMPKLDYEKTFDRVNSKNLISDLKFQGSPSRWIKWMNLVYSLERLGQVNTGIGSIAISNRGIKQGNPPCLLLFNIILDLLQSNFRLAHTNSVVKTLRSTRVSLR